MSEVTTAELKTLRESNDGGFNDHDDAFIDFATEDFINKNIRVRPVSGVTVANDEKASTMSKARGDDSGMDRADDDNRLALFEMDLQRKAVKQKVADIQEEKRRK